MLERGARQSPRAGTIELLARALQLGRTERDALVASARRRGAFHRGELPETATGAAPQLTAHFVGREAELAALHRQLRHRGRVAVHGLGGVGKSQLVLRYLHDRRADYRDGIFWLRADQEATLLGDLAGLAWHLRLPERAAAEQERQLEAVLRRLGELPCWLMVLDNLEAAAMPAVERWLSATLPGRLVVTSRTPAWPSRLGLEPLPIAIAARFLLERTRQRDREGAIAVAATLGCLPLALEQAAAFLQASGRDLASYAALLRTRLVELMEEGKPEGYPKPVATTWQLSILRVERERPAAALLLRLCAFLAPDDIPVSVLQAGAGELPQELRATVTDDIEFDRAVALLRRYSLVDRQGDRLRVHRLVQAVVRESLEVEEREAWLAATIRLLSAAHPDDPEECPQDWPLCARLLPHVQVVADIGGAATEPRPLSRILDRAGTYLRTRGEFRLAVSVLERALAIREAALGADDADVAASLSNLGLALTRLDELDAARPLHERALRIRERLLAPDDPQLAESIERLGYVLQAQGDLDAAQSLFERTIAIREKVLGPEHTDTTQSVNNLAVLLLEKGEPRAARPLHERVLAVRERLLGPDHPRTAASLNNLAMVLRDLQEWAAARVLLERALASKEKVLGPNHPGTATSMNNLALILRDLGELEAARQLFERVVKVLEQSLGARHITTAKGHRNLGRLLARMGDHAAAGLQFEQAIDILERARGPGHPETVATRREREQIARGLF